MDLDLFIVNPRFALLTITSLDFPETSHGSSYDVPAKAKVKSTTKQVLPAANRSFCGPLYLDLGWHMCMLEAGVTLLDESAISIAF